MASSDAASRISAMDGLRGWAALSVVIFHLTYELWGHARPEFRALPFNVIGSGRLAVAIFFSLSGYVLTIRRWRRDDNPPYWLTAFRRYVRLTIPIFVASMLYFAVMALGLAPVGPASVIIENRAPVGVFGNFEPNFLEALRFGVLYAYWPGFYHAYHPFLWTMFIELWGSFLVFFFSQNTKVFREPYSPLLLFAVLWLFLFPLAACFFLGALVALLQRDGVLFKNPPTPRESMIATVLFVAGVVGAGWMHVSSETMSLATTKYLIPSALTGVVVTFAAVRSLPVSRFLMRPFSQGLAHLSFPVYLAHGIVAISFTALLVMWTASFGPIDDLDVLLIATASVLASFALAQLLLPVEVFTLSLVSRIRRPSASRA
ncbi:MAG: acyltransferase [Devosia sp.]